MVSNSIALLPTTRERMRLVERFHRHLKSALRARLEGPKWIDALSWFLLGIRTAPKEDLVTPSAELIYGAPDIILTTTSDLDHATFLQKS